MSDPAAENSAPQRARDVQVQGGGERQAAVSIDRIRPDHVARYDFAVTKVGSAGTVLDLACGVGYGSWIIAEKSNCQRIIGMDISAEAIAYGREFYKHPKIEFREGDCTATGLPAASVDLVVSFETIEHIPDAPAFLREMRRVLKPGGQLIGSTPNQEQLPFTPEAFPFHVRHYLPSELTALLGSHGFAIEEVVSNVHRKKRDLTAGWDGLYNIVSCRLDRQISLK